MWLNVPVLKFYERLSLQHGRVFLDTANYGESNLVLQKGSADPTFSECRLLINKFQMQKVRPNQKSIALILGEKAISSSHFAEIKDSAMMVDKENLSYSSKVDSILQISQPLIISFRFGLIVIQADNQYQCWSHESEIG